MKIAYLFPRYPLPTQTFARSDIAELIRCDHDVSIFDLRSSALPNIVDGILIDRPSIGTVVIFPFLFIRNFRLAVSYLFEIFRSFSGLKASLLALYFFPRALEIAEDLSRDKYDIVHAFWGHYPSAILYLYKGMTGRVITSFLGAYDLYKEFPFTHKIIPELDLIFTHSFANLPLLADRGITTDQVVVIHRGIPLQALQRPDKQRIQGQFCTASALDASKRVDLVLDVFAGIHRLDSSVTLKVIGDGPEKDNLIKKADELGIAESVEFVGFLPRQEVFEGMCESEIFLFFSQKESDRLPNVVKEAMYAGAYCIVSPTLGIDELIPSDNYGTVTASVGEAVQMSMSLLQDKSRLNKVGKLLRTHIEDNFSSEASMLKYLECWSDLLKPN